MIRAAVLISAFFAVGFCCDAFPNGTDTTLNWFPSCTSKITVYSVFATDGNGNAEYPIHLSAPLYAQVNLTNNGNVYDQMKLTTNLWNWGGFSGCEWHSLPTLGLLSNLDACTNGIPCPIPQGNQQLTITMDFSKFGDIISLLQDDKPYQIQQVITAPNGDTLCITVQARARIK
uniref:MD-2-related lipid-recognition domain-containing protein n=1 Tax=Panagrolaimus sp. PS1159 TaxID=55785 RepID=A0AC35FBW0_9BILA